ncbi:MAG: ABC transporter ATP-binding protein [Deltaproteobacteria bacterium]|nr:ABC transporter ATP-binding protein [Deltaproteobacteria bacterium]
MTDQINKGLLCCGISKTFSNHQALIKVDLSVNEGDILTILGPSGCGKTTLLRIIAGLELPDEGRLYLDDVELTKWPASKRPVNTVFQSYALFPHLDVFSNVAFGLQARKTPKLEIKNKVKAILALIRMDGLEKRFPHQLSGGQKQRVALARALVNEPRILLLDEPMSALDAHLRSQVQQELRAIQQKLGTTFILVTHDHNETKRLSNQLVVMNEGRIIQRGPTAEVFSKPENEFVAEFLGATNFFEAYKRADAYFDTDYGTMELDDKPSWKEGKFFIWPEKVVIQTQDVPETYQANNWFKGLVKDHVFNGQGQDVLLVKESSSNPQQIPILVKVEKDFKIEKDQKVGVHFPSKHLVALENRTTH